MKPEDSLHQRRRTPRAHELDGVPWLRLLLPPERDRALAALCDFTLDLVGERWDDAREVLGNLAPGFAQTNAKASIDD